LIGVSEPRTYLVEMLDHIRRQEQNLALSKAHYLLLADANGLSAAEIAEAVGMSSSGVRRAIRRAASCPPYLGSGDAAGRIPEVP
jgi:DNA-directed RNA polymerase specialized sigma24 family protein